MHLYVHIYIYMHTHTHTRFSLRTPETQSRHTLWRETSTHPYMYPHILVRQRRSHGKHNGGKYQRGSRLYGTAARALSAFYFRRRSLQSCAAVQERGNNFVFNFPQSMIPFFLFSRLFFFFLHSKLLPNKICILQGSTDIQKIYNQW